MKTTMKLFCLFVLVFFLVHLCKKRGSVEAELFLSNVEALASGENADRSCFGVGSLDCPQDHSKVYYIW
ncbi:NVEALA domain-containing protein [uncultured Bacteroides sp.]|uniref:NVEALA domain-containing protein n=1 Tax=uncultured Bacteroides sp. TaxID=162156 RepID=UPI002AAB1D85|nr:NVEALA domain-containing protein [uncultured Bacteroides sp.]